MKDIKSAVEALVRRVTESTKSIPKNKTSLGDNFKSNQLLRTDSDFMRGLAMNDPDLRSILEHKDFDPSMDKNMADAISSISDSIRSSLKELILVTTENNRAYFNLDPTLAINDIKLIIDSLTPEMVEELTKYDELIKSGDLKYRDDEQDYINSCMEEFDK